MFGKNDSDKALGRFAEFLFRPDTSNIIRAFDVEYGPAAQAIPRPVDFGTRQRSGVILDGFDVGWTRQDVG